MVQPVVSSQEAALLSYSLSMCPSISLSADFIRTSVIEAADQTDKVKTVSKQQVLDWVVTAWQKMKDKKELITKTFQVTGITSTNPSVVRSDEVLKRATEAVQRELSLEENGDEDDFSEDPFADIELDD